MPKNFVRKTFGRWLAQNSRHFTHQPRIVLKRKDFFMLQFSRIAPQINCFISKRGNVEIRVGYQKEDWDIIMEFDVHQSSTPSGKYYCRSCEEREMFSSRRALWEKHCFEPLLEWTKDNFKESNWVCLIGKKDSYTAASIREKEEVAVMKNHEDFFTAFPVMIRKGIIKI